MRRGPALAAGFAAFMMLLSGFAHSVLGWRAMGEQLAQTNAPADLVQGLGIGWVFGGVCMFAFAVVVGWTSRALWRGDDPPRTPILAIGVSYVLFGIGALVVSGGELFFTGFIVLGMLAVYAGVPAREQA